LAEAVRLLSAAFMELKPTQMKHVLQFHEGRGQQANRFGQRSSQCPMQHGPRGSG
jgi:hypothetical protein